MNPSKFHQACQQCRRLKKKCSKDLPSCTACQKHAKQCRYLSNNSTSIQGSSQNLDQPSSSMTRVSTPQFPLPFFLDRSLFNSMTSTEWLMGKSQLQLRDLISGHLDLHDLSGLFQDYFHALHWWLPMVSWKRLTCISGLERDPCKDLLLLCMKIHTISRSDSTEPALDSSYTLAKSLASTAENSGSVSLRLIQSLVLLSVYEFYHAIYPASYLTIGRASRLGLLMGWHDKNSTNLFSPADTWTLREEQRRTWWAIFILDKMINIEAGDQPYATPDPSHDDLLPTNDNEWYIGKVAANHPLFTTSFSSVTALGPFARTCQAAHMLSKVAKNKEARIRSKKDVTDLLDEAIGLNKALLALQASIEESGTSDSYFESAKASSPAMAVCISARFLLCHTYGCADMPGPTGSHTSHETDMQTICVAGLRNLALSRVPTLARINSQCPLLARCYYFAANACAWYIREHNEQEMWDTLLCMIKSLKYDLNRFCLADEYILLLKKKGVLDLMDMAPNLRLR